ncbi:BsuPI-related putative proteinase inhibitor [Halosolutus amylolyticus]|uniref:Intracellular proteinase inhibitor BsuPI domain-containing protein n=1 Tax=Halosolutus amylolyticus TaxID=2932267 RepID=A0ABD5PTR0_9EURY|nr:BsuPI-related putative proteinase inhibitor [Halosolutus amylolyticus]
MELEGDLDVQVPTDAGDGTVAFTFSVTNAGADPIELQFSDACKAEFVVRADGQEVWRFTDGRMFAQVLGSDRLAPDETATYDGEWSDPQPGSYTAVAELEAQNATCEARTEFTV